MINKGKLMRRTVDTNEVRLDTLPDHKATVLTLHSSADIHWERGGLPRV